MYQVWLRKYKNQGNKTYRRSPYLCLKVFLNESVGGDGTASKGGGPVRSLPGQLCNIRQHKGQCWGLHCGIIRICGGSIFRGFHGYQYLTTSLCSQSQQIMKHCHFKINPQKYNNFGCRTYISLSQELLHSQQNVKHSLYELIKEIFTFLQTIKKLTSTKIGLHKIK